MLVPSPNTELRTMIGDQDADDTSDLSETGSDIDDAETVASYKNILVDSRTIIGGKNLLNNNHPVLLGAHEDFVVQPITEVYVHANMENLVMNAGMLNESGIYIEDSIEDVMQELNANVSYNSVPEAKNDIVIFETTCKYFSILILLYTVLKTVSALLT